MKKITHGVIIALSVLATFVGFNIMYWVSAGDGTFAGLAIVLLFFGLLIARFIPFCPPSEFQCVEFCWSCKTEVFAVVILNVLLLYLFGYALLKGFETLRHKTTQKDGSVEFD